jgi:hypothetical protein
VEEKYEAADISAALVAMGIKWYLTLLYFSFLILTVICI